MNEDDVTANEDAVPTGVVFLPDRPGWEGTSLTYNQRDFSVKADDRIVIRAATYNQADQLLPGYFVGSRSGKPMMVSPSSGFGWVRTESAIFIREEDTHLLAQEVATALNQAPQDQATDAGGNTTLEQAVVIKQFDLGDKQELACLVTLIRTGVAQQVVVEDQTFNHPLEQQVYLLAAIALPSPEAKAKERVAAISYQQAALDQLLDLLRPFASPQIVSVLTYLDGSSLSGQSVCADEQTALSEYRQAWCDTLDLPSSVAESEFEREREKYRDYGDFDLYLEKQVIDYRPPTIGELGELAQFNTDEDAGDDEAEQEALA